MRKRILYLGIDPSRFSFKDAELIHQPLIQTIPIQKLPDSVLEVWPQVTHLISTSPRAAEHWLSMSGVIPEQPEESAFGASQSPGVGRSKLARIFPIRATFRSHQPRELSLCSKSRFFRLFRYIGKQVLAIGEGTASKWKERGIEPIVAPFATQEGMMELLTRIQPPFVLYPRSAKARPLLHQFLQKTNLQHVTFDLYDTKIRIPQTLFPLDAIDQIVFTSPSVVEAFFLLYKTIPQRIEFLTIGPVTKKALEKKM